MIKKLLLIISIALPLFAFSLAPKAFAADQEAVNSACKGINLVTGGTGNCDSNTDDLNKPLRTGIRIFQFVIGVISIVTIMLGGLRFVNSNGDASKVAQARNTIIYAVVGLVIVVLAQAIVQFVLKKSV